MNLKINASLNAPLQRCLAACNGITMTASVQCHGENESGMRVFSTKLAACDMGILQQAHASWLTCCDSLIEQSKDIVCRAFELSDEINDVKGMACGDFLYLFNADRQRHYFVCVDGLQAGQVLCYECEAEMGFAPEAKFDTVLLMVQDGFGKALKFE